LLSSCRPRPAFLNRSTKWTLHHGPFNTQMYHFHHAYRKRFSYDRYIIYVWSIFRWYIPQPYWQEFCIVDRQSSWLGTAQSLLTYQWWPHLLHMWFLARICRFFHALVELSGWSEQRDAPRVPKDLLIQEDIRMGCNIYIYIYMLLLCTCQWAS
jgi:hypothetical protein